MKILKVMLLVLLLFPLVSATIVIDDDFDSLYNVGDLIEVNFSVQRSMDVSGFVEAVLDCDDEDFVLKKDYVLIEADKKRYFAFESPLSIPGDCWVKVVFLNEEERSEEFEVSDRLVIDYTLNDKFFLPYENISINGTVVKENGDLFDGLLRVTLEDLDEKSVEVVNGNFNFNYEIRSDSYPKEYILEIEAFERDAWDAILNSGRKVETIEIRPKATSLKINSIEEFNPPYELIYSVELFDQIERPFENETVVVKLKNPLGEVVFQDEVEINENISYNFSGSSIKGGWTLNAYYGGLVSTKPLYIDENKELFSYVSGNVLVFENIGNVPYVGMVQFSLGNGSFEDEFYVNVSVPVGEVYEYPVYYVGEYNVTLDGNNLGFLPLTGYAIGDGENIDWKTYLVLGFVLVLLFLAWFFVFKKRILLKGEKGEEKIEHMGNVKEVVLPPTKKIVLKETEEGEIESVNKKTYILFFETNIDPSAFEGIIQNYGYKLNQVDGKLGYTFFYEKEGVNSEKKVYNLAKAIMKFSEIQKAKTSIVINRGQFESKISLLKKFALLNRSLLKFVKGQILMTKKFYDSLKIDIPKRKEIIEVLDRRLEVYLV